MSKPTMNLQDGFLNNARRDNGVVRIVLLDGSRLTGRLRGFDNFTLVVDDRETQHLVYKHAIAQIETKRAAGGPNGDARPEDSGEANGAPAESGRREDPRGGRGPRPDAPPRDAGRGEANRATAPRAAEKTEPKAAVNAFNPIDFSSIKPEAK